MKTVLVLATLLVFAKPTQASEFVGGKCERILTHSENIQVGRFWYPDAQRCYMDIHPMDVTEQIYRDYLFTNEGQLMVFNSYGDGEISKSTGARVYYLFPRKYDYPDVAFEENRDVTVRLISGHLVRYDATTMKIASVSGLQFTEDKRIRNDNKGGVELSPTQGLLLDIGFAIGKSPGDDPNQVVQFKDFKGNTCRVKNKDVFNYKTEDPVFKFTDAELQVFLKKSCPKILFTL